MILRPHFVIFGKFCPEVESGALIPSLILNNQPAAIYSNKWSARRKLFLQINGNLTWSFALIFFVNARITNILIRLLNVLTIFRSIISKLFSFSSEPPDRDFTVEYTGTFGKHLPGAQSMIPYRVIKLDFWINYSIKNTIYVGFGKGFEALQVRRIEYCTTESFNIFGFSITVRSKAFQSMASFV
jgi:hypothetical protein